MVKKYEFTCWEIIETTKPCNIKQTEKILIKINTINRIKKWNSSTCKNIIIICKTK